MSHHSLSLPFGISLCLYFFLQAAFRFKEAGRIHVQSEETKGLIPMFTHSPLLGDCTLFVLVLHNTFNLFPTATYPGPCGLM
jgi:hypothetical protein